MRIVIPEFEIQVCKYGEEYKHIERVGRTCYKSENKISEDGSSAVEFVSMLTKRNHLAMIEHAALVFRVTSEVYELFMYPGGIAEEFENVTGQKCYIKGTCDVQGLGYVISGNLRAWLEALEVWTDKYELILPDDMFNEFARLREVYGRLIDRDNVYAATDFAMGVIDTDGMSEANISTAAEDWVEKNGYISEVIDDIAVFGGNENEVKNHLYTSVKVVCDRGVSHELVRHRPCSFGQESTRYVNYSLGKYGNQINVIDIMGGIERDAKTGALDKDTIALIFAEWLAAMKDAEKHYLRMIELGASAQIARSVLPNSTKTEINITANAGEWEHFFMLRDDKAAHPQMREIAEGLHKAMLDANRVLK